VSGGAGKYNGSIFFDNRSAYKGPRIDRKQASCLSWLPPYAQRKRLSIVEKRGYISSFSLKKQLINDLLLSSCLSSNDMITAQTVFYDLAKMYKRNTQSLIQFYIKQMI